MNNLEYDKAAGWTNYPKGMMNELVKTGAKFDHGFDLYVHGNMPDGAGLSSSASIELLTGAILNTAFNLGVSQLDLVKIGQKCEKTT